MKRSKVGLVVLAALSVAILAGAIGVALGVHMATSVWRKHLPELGKIIARTNAGESVGAQHWPSDIGLVLEKSEGESLTVYMGVAGDTRVDLTFDDGLLVSLSGESSGRRSRQRFSTMDRILKCD